MYKTIRIAANMNDIRFSNIDLRKRRLRILEEFLSRIAEFKMCWLDKWIYERVTRIESQFQAGLRQIKLLDCWCVALWQFTSVGISAVVICAYYLFGYDKGVDNASVLTPSTFVYFLNMLNFPLNALSWYVAGTKTAERAIEEIKRDVRLH
jgi:ABC-type multidrug transport system fused ATPase/permease subunit